MLYVIGGGKMGEAIVGGALKKTHLEASDILVIDPNPARLEVFASSYGVAGQQSMEGLQAGAEDLVLLSVKPQSMDELLSAHASQIDEALIISIAVGITTAKLASFFKAGTRIVKVMPNTPALVGKGVSLLSAHEDTPEADLDRAVAFFGSFGKAYAIEESKQNAGAAISGSGPAYFALVVDALTRAGVKQGLPRELAEDLSVGTMAGTAKMLRKLDIHPEELVDMVSSPGGTTIEAIAELEDYKIRAAFSSAIEAAVKRAEEL